MILSLLGWQAKYSIALALFLNCAHLCLAEDAKNQKSEETPLSSARILEELNLQKEMDPGLKHNIFLNVFIEKLDKFSNRWVQVDETNLCKAPSNPCQTVQTLKKGQKVIVVSEQEGWVKLNSNLYAPSEHFSHTPPLFEISFDDWQEEDLSPEAKN